MRTLKKIGEHYVLHHNATPLACALVNPIPMPGRLQGSVTMEQRACGEMCPLFLVNYVSDELFDNKPVANVQLCMQSERLIPIIEEKPPEKGSKLFQGTKI